MSTIGLHDPPEAIACDDPERRRRRNRMDRHDPAYKGQRDYNALLLAAYDPLVLGPIARFVWRCPTTRLVELYRQHIRDRHLDIGPGTGYFLEHAGLSSGSRITIVDPNRNVLRHVSRRLRTLDVTS